MSCKYCDGNQASREYVCYKQDCDGVQMSAFVYPQVYRLYVVAGDIDLFIPINHCPMCGRKL